MAFCLIILVLRSSDLGSSALRETLALDMPAGVAAASGSAPSAAPVPPRGCWGISPLKALAGKRCPTVMRPRLRLFFSRTRRRRRPGRLDEGVADRAAVSAQGSRLLDVVPTEYRSYGISRRHPAALASMAQYHTLACLEGTARATERSGPNSPSPSRRTR